jgi:pre-mRNA-processing factor SLU7
VFFFFCQYDAMASSNQNRLSRDDWKKAKELEELRKTGAAPPELDEDGKMINPHIPQYISAAPWYLNNQRPGLKHQANAHWLGRETFASVHESRQRGLKEVANTRYVKGACENCGATSHKTKECTERPRKKGAKLTNQDIRPDEYVKDVRLDFEGKRDRWAGYNPDDYKKVFEHHERLAAERRKKKAEEMELKYKNDKAAAEAKLLESIVGGDKLKKGKREGDESGSDVDTDSDSDVDDELDDRETRDSGKVIQKRAEGRGGVQSVRNLRIREDLPNYLINLDVNSAYFDPKTRVMRDNPHVNKDADEVEFAGLNAVRLTGDVLAVAARERFAHDMAEKSGYVMLS